MKLTNKYNLPEAIVNATRKVSAMYNAKADRSVTQLLMPPRIDLLRKQHYKDIEQDVSEEFFALLGTATHHILEIGAEHRHTTEERLFLDVNGWTVSGAIDVQDIRGGRCKITDYKVTTAYSYVVEKGGAKPEWIAQQNLYALLMRKNKNIVVDRISICAIYRDWKASDAQRDPLYPPAPVVEIEVPVWPDAEQEQFLLNRVEIHQHAELVYELTGELPECSQAERWSRNTRWSVIKKGGKRASKTFYEEEAAKEYLEEKGEGYEIIRKEGASSRCKGNYCGVAPWCSQWQGSDDKSNAEEDGQEA